VIALNVANVDATPTDTGIQRRTRSFLTSDRAAARVQPTNVRPWRKPREPLQGSGHTPPRPVGVTE